MHHIRKNLSLFLISIIWLFCIIPTAHAVEIILDNNSAGTETTGTWTRSAGVDFYGTPSLYSRDVDATYSYTMQIKEPGTYDVNLWWTEYFSRSTNVAVDIKHHYGTTRIFINQKESGGQWNKIGSWYFAADAVVTIHSDPANNSTNADAVQLVSINSDGSNSAPIISGTPATIITVETAYSFTPDATDANGDNIEFNISNKPDWVDFNPVTGALTGTPEIQDAGTTTPDILISVSDGELKTSLAAFSITVAPENSGGSAIKLTLDNNQPGTRSTGTWTRSAGLSFYGAESLYSRDTDATYSYTIQITEPGTYDVNLWWTEYFSRSTNVAVDVEHRDGTARIFINQKENGAQWNKIGSWYFAADAVVTIHSDPENNSTNADAVQLVSVNPGGNNSAPTISGTPATTVTVETAYSFIPDAKDDNDGDNLTFSISNIPSWASFDTNTGALTGTPAISDEGTTPNIVISVNDGAIDASLAAFSITVSGGGNKATPIAQNDSGYSTEQSSAISIPVLDNDRGLDDGPIQVTVIQSPSNGTTEILSNNSIRYTPDNDFLGSDSFVYKITDVDGDITTATVMLEVIACASCPAADVVLNLSWDANPAEENVTGYNVYYGDSSSTVNSLYKTFTENSAGFDLSAPSIDTNANLDLSLQAGDDVCFKISASNSGGESSQSAAVCETI